MTETVAAAQALETSKGNETGVYPTRRYAFLVLGVLMVITLCSQLDRNLTSLLAEPIRMDLGLSDTQISVIHGIGFAVIYAVMGVPFGWLVDRSNRRNLIAFGIVGWSIMTFLCGLTNSFWQLLIARMGVGVGEAVLAPAAYSMIADCFEPRVRGRALAAYHASLTVGGAASLILGGLLLAVLPLHFAMPLIAEPLEKWQLVFVIASLPGIPLAFLLLTFREPVRIEQAQASPAAKKAEAAEFFRYVWRNPRAFLFVYLAFGIVGFVALGANAWAPTLFVRKFGVDLSVAGPMSGFVLLIAGVSGAAAGGSINDYLADKPRFGRRFGVAAVALIVMTPLFVLWPLMNSLTLSLIGFGLATFGSVIAVSCFAPTIQDIVPNRMRGQAVAVFFLLAGIVAIGLGPTGVALVTDNIFGDPAALPYSLALVGGVFGIIGLIVFLLGVAPYVKTRDALYTQLAEEARQSAT